MTLDKKRKRMVMKHVLIVWNNLINNRKRNEISLSNSPSSLPPSDALRLLHACPFLINGGIWSDGIPILQEAKGGSNCYLCLTRLAVPAIHQDCSWTNDMERGGCDCGGIANYSVDKRTQGVIQNVR